jgi:hypothetical protein
MTSAPALPAGRPEQALHRKRPERTRWYWLEGTARAQPCERVARHKLRRQLTPPNVIPPARVRAGSLVCLVPSQRACAQRTEPFLTARVLLHLLLLLLLNLTAVGTWRLEQGGVCRPTRALCRAPPPATPRQPARTTGTSSYLLCRQRMSVRSLQTTGPPAASTSTTVADLSQQPLRFIVPLCVCEATNDRCYRLTLFHKATKKIL